MSDSNNPPATNKVGNRIAFFSLIATTIGVLIAYWGLPAPAAKTYGSCSIQPQTPANANRLHEYSQQGRDYANQGHPDLATRKFQQILQADPNYLGANQNLGTSLLAQNKIGDAQAAFEKELHLIDCLNSVQTSDLAKFAYVLGPSEAAKGDDQKADRYKDRLGRAEDTVHYNLACLLAKENYKQGAIEELKNAGKNGSISRNLVIQDSDFKSIRNSPEFKTVLETKFDLAK